MQISDFFPPKRQDVMFKFHHSFNEEEGRVAGHPQRKRIQQNIL